MKIIISKMYVDVLYLDKINDNNIPTKSELGKKRGSRSIRMQFIFQNKK